MVKLSKSAVVQTSKLPKTSRLLETLQLAMATVFLILTPSSYYFFFEKEEAGFPLSR